MLPCYKDTNRKIRKNKFIYICGSKNGYSRSAVNTGEVLGDASHVQKAPCLEFGTKIQVQWSMKNVVLIFLLVSLPCYSVTQAYELLFKQTYWARFWFDRLKDDQIRNTAIWVKEHRATESRKNYAKLKMKIPLTWQQFVFSSWVWEIFLVSTW